jgi:hypothetical protein
MIELVGPSRKSLSFVHVPPRGSFSGRHQNTPGARSQSRELLGPSQGSEKSYSLSNPWQSQ